MKEIKSDLPIIPLRDVVVFPGIVTTLFVGRPKSIEALNVAMASNKKLVLVSQLDPAIEDPEFKDLYQNGSISNLLQLIKLPDGTMKVLVEGHKRCSIEALVEKDSYDLARVISIDDIPLKEADASNLVRFIKAKFEDYIGITKRIPPEIVSTVDSLDDLSKLIDTITGHLPIETSKKQEILSIADLKERSEKVLMFIESQLDVVDVEKKIRERVKKQMEKSQREYYLNEQIKAAQKELGEIGDEGDELEIKKGIEIGHIFQLGEKYSQAMSASVLDQNGKAVPMQMGCYGIGVTRLLAACIEQNHDDKGIIWPDCVTPFQLIILQIDAQKSSSVTEVSESLYSKALTLGIETLFDDRDKRTSPGVKFNESELIGIPHRIVVSPRSLKDDCIEYTSRGTGQVTRINLEGLDEFLINVVCVK